MRTPHPLQLLRSWWSKHRPRPLHELLAVEFDDEQVRVTVLERLEEGWNQEFSWRNIERVCFQDAGLSHSDVLFITVKGRTKPVVVLTEAKGGLALVGALAEKGYFPEQVWREALGETSGRTHCWPPQENST